MSTANTAPKRAVRPFSIRRHVNRKILRFSVSMGAAAAVSTAFVYLGSAYPLLRRSQQVNLRTLSEINCTGSACDTSVFTTDWQIEGADYVLDTQTRYFLSVPTSPEQNPTRFTPLDFSDTAFIAKFREPASYYTLDGEVWRLYSRRSTLDGKNLEIMIGYAEKAPWKMLDTPRSLMRAVDARLMREADKIAEGLSTANGPRVPRARAAQKLSADGFEVVDASTGEVVDWGPWLPTFLPKDTSLPTSGRRFYLDEAELYILQTDTNGRLLATSLVPVGDLWWFALLAALALVSTTLIARGLSRRFLRNYFALAGVRVPTLEEARRHGEGQRVEFKRGLSADETRTSSVEDELLKSIAAFANTNDGVMFIGVDDSGNIRGLDLDFSQRDRLEQKIRQLVRNRIKPTPPIQVSFEDVRGLAVARVAVARGEAPAYLLNGVIYVRYGSSDVQAQPEDLKRLVAEYAF